MSEAQADSDQQQDGYDLSETEIRVLAVLMEKAFITPDAYPLSINSITTGCNQLTGRDPVMALDEQTVRDAVTSLAGRRLVSRRDTAGGRVDRFEHQIRLRYSLPPPEQAVLAVLMLRGAQTAGELRQRTERMHAFADIAAVEAVLEHLADKYPPMVAALPRAPGTKEIRHVHLLGGESIEALAERQALSDARPHGTRTAIEEEVRKLREELDSLRIEFDRFRSQFD